MFLTLKSGKGSEYLLEVFHLQHQNTFLQQPIDSALNTPARNCILGQQEGSVGEGVCHQTSPEVDPQGPHGGKCKSSLTHGSLISTQVLWQPPPTNKNNKLLMWTC